MARFFQISATHFINLDQVTMVHDTGKEVRLFLTDARDGNDFEELTSPRSDELRALLKREVVNPPSGRDKLHLA